MKKFFQCLKKMSLFRKNIWKKSVVHEQTFRRWLISSFCVVSVFILCGTIIYNVAMQTTKQTVMKMRSSAIQQTGELIDSYLLNVREDVSMLLNNKVILAASYIGKPIAGEDFYSYHRAGEECKGVYLYGNVSDIFLYYGEGECFVDCSQLYYGDEVNTFVMDRFQMNFAQWQDFVFTQHYGEFWCLAGKIFYLCPLKNRSSEQGMLIAQIDSEGLEFFLRTDKEPFIDSTIGYIINDQDEIVVSIPASLQIPYSYGELQLGANFLKDNVVTCYKLNQSSMEYISIIPVQQYMHEIYQLKQVLYLYIVICILGGVWIVYTETKWRYRPIQNINRKLQKLEPQTATSDSFLSFQNKVFEIIENNRKMQTLLRKEQTLFFGDQFTSWVHGQISTAEIQTMLSNSFHMSFSQGVVISVNVLSDLKNVELDYAELIDMLLICLNNITAELLGKEFRCFFWNYEGILGIVWTNKEENLENHIRDIFEQVRFNIHKYFGIELRFSLSKGCSDISDIALSYRQARVTNDYCSLVEQSGIVLYEDSLLQPFSAWKNKAIIQAEKEFTTYMIDKDYPRAKAKMELIIDYYKFTDGISMQLLRCRMFGLINLMLDAISAENANEDIWAFMDMDYPQRLLQADTIPKLENVLMSILQELILSNTGDNGSIKEKLNLIDLYIENHYDDQSLSVQMLADHFHLSVPYLSSTYKQVRQTGILNKIQTCRIDHAKELLVQEPNMSLAQIAAKIGYNNVQTMIRIFKKLENETPGKYRENNMKNNHV